LAFRASPLFAVVGGSQQAEKNADAKGIAVV
jgi:hypothetical protein